MDEARSAFPPLPLKDWEQTKNTLHLFLQIVGKVRLTLHTNAGQEREVPLRGLSVADFYRGVFSALAELGIEVRIRAVPYDVPFSTLPFEQDTARRAYDERYVERFWRILCQVDSILREFRGRFVGKSTPIQLYWHHLDLVLTRFCGKPAPEAGGNRVNREAYSHEVISFGFWAGDARVRETAFYSYTYPLPAGLYDQPLQPSGAFWDREGGYALLRYEQVRRADDPRQAVLDFLESTYQTGARLAGWDLEALRLRPAD